MKGEKTLLKDKDFYSTGALATMCRVTKRTIIAAIERKEIVASITPGGHNRIGRDSALEFMKKHHLYPQEKVRTSVLIIDEKKLVFGLLQQLFSEEKYNLYYAGSSYEAGRMVELHKPDLVIFDTMFSQFVFEDFFAHINGNLFGKKVKVLGLVPIDTDDEEIPDKNAFEAILLRPFTVESLREQIVSLLSTI